MVYGSCLLGPLRCGLPPRFDAACLFTFGDTSRDVQQGTALVVRQDTQALGELSFFGFFVFFFPPPFLLLFWAPSQGATHHLFIGSDAHGGWQAPCCVANSLLAFVHSIPQVRPTPLSLTVSLSSTACQPAAAAHSSRFSRTALTVPRVCLCLLPLPSALSGTGTRVCLCLLISLVSAAQR